MWGKTSSRFGVVSAANGMVVSVDKREIDVVRIVLEVFDVEAGLASNLLACLLARAFLP